MRSKKSDRRKQYNYLQGGDAAAPLPSQAKKSERKTLSLYADACFVDDAISNWSLESAADIAT
jgi:hypothetical protein